MKTFTGIEKLREFSTTSPALQEILNETIWPETKSQNEIIKIIKKQTETGNGKPYTEGHSTLRHDRKSKEDKNIIKDNLLLQHRIQLKASIMLTCDNKNKNAQKVKVWICTTEWTQ